jgi:beta-galactosidase
LQKPSGAALVSYSFGNATLVLSSLDYTIDTKETTEFWQTLFSAMGITYSESDGKSDKGLNKEHDLLMDGPVE